MCASACNKKALILTCSTYKILLRNAVFFIYTFFFFTRFSSLYSFTFVDSSAHCVHTDTRTTEGNKCWSKWVFLVRFAPPRETQRMRWIYGNVDFSRSISPLVNYYCWFALVPSIGDRAMVCVVSVRVRWSWYASAYNCLRLDCDDDDDAKK